MVKLDTITTIGGKSEPGARKNSGEQEPGPRPVGYHHMGEAKEIPELHTRRERRELEQDQG